MSTDPISELYQKTDQLDYQNAMEGAAKIESDSFNTGIESRNSLSKTNSKIVLGYILETCPTTHAYKVAIAGGKLPVLCCALQTGGGNPSLIFDSSFYAVGSTVLVALQPQFGVILGAVPLDGMGNDLIVGNRTSHASQNYPDGSDKACMDMATKKRPDVGLRHFGHGLPMDTTDLGESGHTSATGVRNMLNSFMTFMAVDDYTGLWAFDEDKLLRVSGLNLQVRSAGRENEYLNDNGEYIEYEGNAVYPWEQLGYTQFPYSDIITETPKDEWRKPNTWKAYVEPAQDKAKPFHRVSKYGGFLGQGGFTQVVAPDPEKVWTVFQDKEKLQGLIRVAKSLDGWISSISTSGTIISKRGLVPSISRVNRPDDTSTEIGDNPNNYEKTNNFEAVAEIPTSDVPMERVMGLQDSIAYQQNFKELLPFLQHKNDYYVPEDSELNAGLSRFAQFGELKSKQLIQVKEGPEVQVVAGGNTGSERKVKINPAEAGVACLPDGSVVIYGGCGEEIRMSGGSIFIDAPGDIWFKSGRKTILWGGEDVEVRAKESMDISTTNGSIRIKAEEKLAMLGGNGGKDGVLIESKGTSNTYDFTEGGDKNTFGGILLKAEKGVIGALGSTIYLRSGVMGSGDGIFLDANNGEHSIYTMCNNFENYVETTFNINFSNLKTVTVDATDQFSKQAVYLNGDTTITSSVYTGANIYSGDNLYAIGHVFTGKAKENNLFVGDDSNKMRDKRANMEERIANIEKLSQSASTSYSSKITENIASEGHIANEATLIDSSFTFRTTEEYNLPNEFAVYEARWQNITDNAGQSVGKWEEKPVKDAQYDETYPFPGKEAYTEPGKYITQAWTLTDYSTGLYKNRWSDDHASLEYKDPAYGEQKKKSLNEYPVI